MNVEPKSLLPPVTRSNYDVIIIPGELTETQIMEGHRSGAVPPEFTGGIGEAGVQNLRDFVNEGGTLVTIDKATEFAAKQFALPVKNALEGVKPQDYYVPGSLLKVVLDTENPIAYGMPRETAAFIEQNAAFDVTGNAKAVGTYPMTNPLMSGWILGQEKLFGKTAVVDVPVGRGPHHPSCDSAAVSSSSAGDVQAAVQFALLWPRHDDNLRGAKLEQ